MTDIRLLRYPDDLWRLRRRAATIPEAAFGTPGIRQLGQLMGALMLSHQGVGLAATQVSIDPCWRVITIGTGGSGYSVLCNPEIVDVTGEMRMPEGCLSFWNVHEVLSCPRSLRVRYRTPEGQPREVQCDQAASRVLYHEADHLDGRVMLDRMGNLQRREFIKKVHRKIREAREAAVQRAAGNN